MNKNNKFGFTLVELLAVIVILAIILVIAVPKVMSIIEDAKKGTLESTAKMIASAAEKAKVQNTVLGKNAQIECDDVVKLNNIDYERCIIEFENDTAKVTIKGKGKFAGLNVCNGTKTSAIIQDNICPVSYGDGDTYIANLLANENELKNGLIQTTVTYTNVDNKEVTVDAGIRYTGALANVKNKVYFNCEDVDTNDVAYGEENYDYASSCEIWRIVGVFGVEDDEGNTSKRIKIINIESTFTASWDSSANSINLGYGVNQWGESTYEDGSAYEGADLMQLLNGYYIGKPGSKCQFNIQGHESGLRYVCDAESLTAKKVKPLTSNSLNLVKNAVWNTYAVGTRVIETAYLQENGIIKQFSGKSLCEENGSGDACNDKVIRTTTWTGLVGLMSVTDMTYANGWLYNSNLRAWSITPLIEANLSSYIWYSNFSTFNTNAVCNNFGVWPSVYLSPNVKIIGGNGDDEPYKLSLNFGQ